MYAFEGLHSGCFALGFNVVHNDARSALAFNLSFAMSRDVVHVRRIPVALHHSSKRVPVLTSLFGALSSAVKLHQIVTHDVELVARLFWDREDIYMQRGRFRHPCRPFVLQLDFFGLDEDLLQPSSGSPLGLTHPKY